MKISVEPGEETAEVREFNNLVWPPRLPPEQSPVAHMAWDTSYARRILTQDNSGKILSQVALIFRDAHWNSEPLRVGGIAGVGTTPKFRHNGLATAGKRRAVEILVEEDFDIGALFCAPEMVPFYARLGWRGFDGAVFIKQPGNDHFPWGHCMTVAVKRNVLGGELDVAGLPW
jgi:hypothetical protein